MPLATTSTLWGVVETYQGQLTGIEKNGNNKRDGKVFLWKKKLRAKQKYYTSSIQSTEVMEKALIRFCSFNRLLGDRARIRFNWVCLFCEWRRKKWTALSKIITLHNNERDSRSPEIGCACRGRSVQTSDVNARHLTMVWTTGALWAKIVFNLCGLEKLLWCNYKKLCFCNFILEQKKNQGHKK